MMAGRKFQTTTDLHSNPPMSYAGPAKGSRGSTRAAASPAPQRLSGRPSRRPPEPVEETDWERVALFGAGLALGIAVGAGAALLTAPQSGAETRAVLRARTGRLTRSAARRGHDAWDELREELRSVRRGLRRRRAQRDQERALADLEREIADE